MSQELFQSAFDKAVKGLIAQGCPSRSATGQCWYKDYKGNHCIVGFLLDDWPACIEIQAPLKRTCMNSEEYMLVTDLWKRTGFEFGNEKHEHFLIKLQRCHDDAVPEMGTPNGESNELFITVFKIKAIALALDYNLTLPEELK